MNALGILFSVLWWTLTTPNGWVAMLLGAIVLHGFAVCIRAAFNAC